MRAGKWTRMMELLLKGLRAAAEPTRLRLLALCAHAELTVTELTQILGQSQPRVSRHLKLLCEAGLLERHREGTWAYYRLADTSDCAHLARTLVDLVPEHRELVVAAMGEFYGGAKPASTLVGVPALILAGALVEIDVTAAIDG